MQDDEEIKKGGIVIITNDIVNPRMEIKFFSRKKTRKDCTYDIKDMNEWGTIINNIAKRNR